LIASRLPKGAIYQIIVFPVLRLLFLFLLTVGLARPGFAQILFDATKAETAGNADWVIDADSAGNPQRIPTPTISAINASTAESYWKGGISSWGVALAKLRNAGQITLGGNGIETLPAGASITYGNASNAQDLSHYQAYVVCEPNTLFTAAEKTAILNYVKNGGCLFMIADHSSSDRNNDGYDSLQVWNDLMTNNSVQTNPFGFSFNSYSGSPTAVLNSAASDPLTHGAAGTATQFVFNVGTTMTITNTSTTHASVWQTSPTKVMALYGTYGSGRFVAIGDSSPVDDGTGASGDTLYDGWNSPAGNGIVALNGTLWLLANSTATVIAPTVTTDAATSLLSNGAALNATVNPNGAATTVTFSYGLTTAYGTTASVAGSLAGASAQAASATITGLSAGTVYHYRASAVNSAGTVNGADRTFTTAAAALPDLTLAKTHTSLFRQGLTGLTYTLTATNSGAAATAGPVTVVDTLPVGLTATALTGTGWTVNLGTLTATRSDALAAGSSYPPLTLTVSANADAPASVTNTAAISGGGETNTSNNSASDLTSILSASSGGAPKVVISQLYGGGGSAGAAFSNDYVELFNSGGTPADLTGWSVQYGSSTGTTWQVTALSGSIAPGHYYLVKGASNGSVGSALPAVDANGTVNMSATSGKVALVNSVTALSGANPVGGTSVVDLVGYGAANGYEGASPAPALTVSLAGFRANGGLTDTDANLSDFSAATPLPRNAASPANLPPSLTANLTLAKAHVGTFMQADAGRTYTLTVTNTGTGPTVGTVMVTDMLPAGLTATAISGVGWSTNLSTLTATRSDTLAAASSYPPVTVTVKVAVNAAASVTNTATVSGGGEANTADNLASDPTPITALAPIEAWRFANFGTIALTPDTADTAIVAGDGLPNLIKYALGLDPHIPAVTGIITDTTTGCLRLSVSLNPNASDITCQVEVTSTLEDNASWTNDGTSIDLSTPSFLQVSDGISLGDGVRRFMRLRVTRP